MGMKTSCWLWLGILAVAESACVGRSTLDERPVAANCAFPLDALADSLRAITLDEAEAKARTSCKGLSYASGAMLWPCADGGNLVSRSDAESWRFDAAGHLLAYTWFKQGASDGCNTRIYGDAAGCRLPSPGYGLFIDGQNLCASVADATSSADLTTADASDAPIAADVVPDAAPDILDVAAEIPAENTVCSSQADCAADKWCSYTGCGFTEGQCLPKPTNCAGLYAPVCGCDTHSYDSACHAQKAGQAIAAYSAPCLGTGCTPACTSGHTCVDCASGGMQCLTPGETCAGGK